MSDCPAQICPECPPRNGCPTCSGSSYLACVAHVEGDGCIDMEISCPDCWPHECGQLCEMLGEMISTPSGHEAWHRAQYCKKCGHPKRDNTVGLCVMKQCTVWYCGGCGAEDGSAGPVGCLCERIKYDRISKMHRLYRGRKR